MQKPEPKPNPSANLQIEIPGDLQATYANFALISHTATEFFIDFSQILPGKPKVRVHTRVVMTPIHLKMLYRALGENLSRYEARHGEIQLPPTLADQLFGGLRPPTPGGGSDDDGKAPNDD